MYEEYLIDILQGNRKCDVRLYPTNKRGKIALIKSKTNLIYGYVDLCSIERISYQNYVYWHIGSTYSLEDAKRHIESIPKKKLIRCKNAFSYNFSNPQELDTPIKIQNFKKNGIWIEFDESQCTKSYKKLSLF